MSNGPGPEVVDDLVARLHASSSTLATMASRRMEADLPWVEQLNAGDRSWLGVIAQEAITRFIEWLRDPEVGDTSASEIFRTAPRELARSVSLHQTVALIRLIVEVVEDSGREFVTESQRPLLREGVLTYSREVAFSAAEVYARAAESRGAWDARLEAFAIDAVVRGAPDDALLSHVSTLGWTNGVRAVALVGTAPAGRAEVTAAELRSATRHLTHDAIVGMHGGQVVVVLGHPEDPAALAAQLAESFEDGPVVIGPMVDDVSQVHRSARAARAALTAVAAWPQAPRPLAADDLLPERALGGDEAARETLISDIYTPLLAAGATLVETLDEYIAQGRSLEGAARELYVHPNTVRYRLRRISQLLGWDPTDAREGYVLHTALAVGRLAEATSRRA